VVETEYYQDFLRPMGCGRIFAIWSWHHGGDCVGFGLGRAGSRPAFSAGELESLVTLGSHLNRANRLRIDGAGRRDNPPSAPPRLASFGLTPKEAAVAEAIAAGSGIDRVASALGIGRETVRFHLRAIFQKTDTHSQAQLVSRLLSGERP
jgi:DNA-binding CsgD family transcriptional regulator